MTKVIFCLGDFKDKNSFVGTKPPQSAQLPWPFTLTPEAMLRVSPRAPLGPTVAGLMAMC